MSDRSKKLLRQYKRYLGDPDAESAIAGVAASLRAGEAVGPEKIACLERFSDFIEAVEKSYAEYEDRLKISARNIEISSGELTTAFQRLENLNASINAMLDGLGQGLLFFDREGICSSVYSRACLALLETDPANKALPDVLNFSHEERNTFNSWLGIVFAGAGALDFEDMKELLPPEIVNRKGRIIALDYRPMYVVEDQLLGILLVATDVTYERESEDKLRAIQSGAFKIQQIAQNRNGYHTFLTNFSNFIAEAESLANRSENCGINDVLMRDLHTYKGQASTFSLSALSEAIHDAEAALRGKAGEGLIRALGETLPQIREKLAEEEKYACELFGSEFLTRGRIKAVQLDTVHELRGLVAGTIENKLAGDKICRFINEHLLAVPVFDLFLPFERELVRLAEQQGKAVPECLISGDNFSIVPEPYEDFFNVLVHLARNIIDHGIEMPQERLARGKPERGQISIDIAKIQAEDQRLRITISDDGKGIDVRLLRQKLAEEREIDTAQESDREVIAHIFDPGLSLSSGVTMLSGRGIGMSALKDAVVAMGGTINVTTDFENGLGTSFSFDLPFIN